MRVALCQPASPFLIDQAVHPPLGLFYLGAVLKQHGHEVVYCDRGLGDRIPEADVYGVTATTPQLLPLRSVLAQLKELGKPIIAGGPHATLRPDEVLAMGATAVVRGEGEEVLLDLLRTDIKPGTVVQAKRITNLDALPMVDRAQARRYTYHITDRKGEKRLATTMVSSRGCPYKCSFCSHALWKQHYVARSAANVVAEVLALRDQGWTAVMLFDDTLAVQRQRLVDICAGIKGLGIAWRAFVRGDQVDTELYRLMAAAGCVEIGLGVESGSQRILENVNKGESVETQRKAILWAKREGIRVKTFLIAGLPGEDWESVDATYEFLKQTEPDDVDITVFQAYPGSGIYENPAAFDIEMLGDPVFYKGQRDRYMCSHRTRALSPDDILAARAFLESRFKRRAG